jgi:hypothetical protein
LSVIRPAPRASTATSMNSKLLMACSPAGTVRYAAAQS